MRIAIIGAGFGGMAAAYDLRKAGHDVTIFESADYVGGLASGFKEPHWDWSVEKFYHHWFQSDKYMLGLINELGWQDKVFFPRPLTVMYHKGKFYPFDSILKMRSSSPGWALVSTRSASASSGLFLRLTNNWKALEKTTADAWMMKWAGRNVYEKMWKPLVDRQVRAVTISRSTWPGCGRASRPAQPGWERSKAASSTLRECSQRSCARWESRSG